MVRNESEHKLFYATRIPRNIPIFVKVVMTADRIILGIDPGTQATGYGLIRCKGKKMSLLACGIIKLGRQDIPHPEKLHQIFKRVSSLIDEFKPTELALEAPFYGKNIQSMLKLGRAQGVAMAAGLNKGLSIYEYAPRKVKQAITGNGGASKEQVCGMLEHILQHKLDLLQLDASDGIAVAVCHFFQINTSMNSSSYKDWSAYVKGNPDKIR